MENGLENIDVDSCLSSQTYQCIKSKPLQVDEDFIAAYQMNYGFTPDVEQADTTTENNSTVTTFPDTTQTAKNQVRNIVSSFELQMTKAPKNVTQIIRLSLETIIVAN